MDIRAAFQDPEFRAIPIEAQAKVLSDLDSEFGSIPQDAQFQVIQDMMNQNFDSSQENEPSLLDKTLDYIGMGSPEQAFDNYGRPLIEGGAGIVGGTAGLASPVPGGAAIGGGLGFMMGRQAADRIEEYAGWEQPVSLKEQVGDMVQNDIPEALAGEMLGPIAGKALKPVARFAGNVSNKAGAVIDRASKMRDVGVTPSVADAHQGTWHPKAESFAEVLPINNALARNQAENRIQQYTDGVTQYWDETIPAQPGDSEGIGYEILDKTVDASRQAFNSASQKFKDIPKTLKNPDEIIPLPKFKQAIQDAIQAADSMPGDEGLQVVDGDLRKRLSKLTEGDGFTWQGLQDIRSNLGSDIASIDQGARTGMRGGGTRTSGTLKQLKRALETDMETFSSMKGGNTLQAYKDATESWKTAKQTYGKGSIGADIQRKGISLNPEKIVDGFFTGKTPQLHKLREAKKVLGEDSPEFTRIKRGFLDNILQLSQMGTEKVLPVGQLSKHLSKFDDGHFLQEMFNSGEISMLKKQAEVGDMMNAAFKKFGNFSRTAPNNFLTSALTTGVGYQFDPAMASIYLGIEALSAGLYRTKPGRRLLVDYIPKAKRWASTGSQEALEDLMNTTGAIQALLRESGVTENFTVDTP